MNREVEIENFICGCRIITLRDGTRLFSKLDECVIHQVTKGGKK